MAAVVCTIPANSDISGKYYSRNICSPSLLSAEVLDEGIGVRVSIYIQIFAALIFAHLARTAHDHDLDFERIGELLFPNIILGFSLVAASAIQARDKESGLSVYDALIILNMNWMISLSVLPITQLHASRLPGPVVRSFSQFSFNSGTNATDRHLKANHSIRHKIAEFLTQCPLIFYLFLLHLSATCAFGIWLFATMSHFDMTPTDCTQSTVYYLFGKQIHANNPTFCRVSLALYCIFVIPIINCFAIYLIILAIRFCLQILLFPFALCLPRWFLDWHKQHHVAARLGFALFWTSWPLALLLAFTEKTVALNNLGSRRGEWTFGQ
jgi:hypothetical protein